MFKEENKGKALALLPLCTNVVSVNSLYSNTVRSSRSLSPQSNSTSEGPTLNARSEHPAKKS